MEGLSNNYIEKIGDELIRNHCFIGVFPCDKPPKIDKRKNYSLIFNTGNSRTNGEHFVALYSNKTKLYYFDSLGASSIDINIERFIHNVKGTKNLILCSKPIQHPISTFCGFYCIAFLIFKDRSYEDKKFYAYFNKNESLKNDKKVVYFITQHADK